MLFPPLHESMAFTFSCVFYTGYCGGPPEASGRYQRKGKNCQTPHNVNVSDCGKVESASCCLQWPSGGENLLLR